MEEKSLGAFGERSATGFAEGYASGNLVTEKLITEEDLDDSRTVLQRCKGFQILEDRIIMWSENYIFHGRLDNVSSNEQVLHMKKLNFEVPVSEGYIEHVVGKGPEESEEDFDKYFICVKIITHET